MGKPAQGHTDACRRRMEENLKHDPKVQKANKRIDEFLGRLSRSRTERRRSRMRKRAATRVHLLARTHQSKRRNGPEMEPMGMIIR